MKQKWKDAFFVLNEYDRILLEGEIWPEYLKDLILPIFLFPFLAIAPQVLSTPVLLNLFPCLTALILSTPKFFHTR